MSSDENTVHDALRTTVAESTAPSAGAAVVELPPGGYELGRVLGVGGMGEVIEARDRRFDREVAVKRMRDRGASEAMVARFLREARIQARLDHPATVPVHDLGLDAEGRPYFAMQKLTGTTLERRLADAEKPQRLLRALVDVALAIEFAHDKGIVHRDLKPSNIMLGNFGEVYVLDWGIARVLKDRAVTDPRDSVEDLGGGTQAGDLLGTPGYMAPEQARGEEVGPKADVYALGAILFEILAGEPLHPRGTAGLTATLGSPQQRPSARRPERDVPLELDDACEAALAEDPARRPTARELADRVQSYLDGDRDLARRRAAADQHLAVARAAFASGDPEARATVLHEASNALVLHPGSGEPLRLIKLLFELPAESLAQLPAALRAEIHDAERGESLGRLRGAAVSLAVLFAVFGFAPLLAATGWRYAAAFGAAMASTLALLWGMYVARRPSIPLYVGITLLLSITFSRAIGPFVLCPVILSGTFVAVAANPWVDRHRGFAIAWIAVVMAAPIPLERVGLLRHTFEVTRAGLVSRLAIHVPAWEELLAIVLANVVVVVATLLYVAQSQRQLRAARRKLMIHAWYLGRLLPEGVAAGPAPAPA